MANSTISHLEGLVFTPPPTTKGDEDQETGGSRDKEKGKAVVLLQNDGDSGVVLDCTDDTVEVDWTKFEPPGALTSTENIEADIILQIVEQAIENIKTRILREEQERKTAAEKEVARPMQEEEEEEEAVDEIVAEDQKIEKSEKGKQPETFAAEDLQKESPDEIGEPKRLERSREYLLRLEESRGSTPTSESLTRPIKRTLKGLFKRFNGSPETGESSSAGAARNGVLAGYLQSEYSTYYVRKRFVSDLIKKSMGEQASSHPAASVGEPEVECVSCLDDFNPNDTVKAPCHHYCKPCFERLIASACQNEQQWPPKCCLNNIPESTILASIDDENTARRYRERAVEWNIKVSDRIYCSRPECSLFIPPENILRAEGVAECRGRHLTCIICRNAQHYGEECPQDRDLASTNRLAEEEGWRRCHGCHAFVEHRDACQHMTCRCGAEFCYVCGAQWRTCACTMANLQEYKLATARRRQERREEERRIAEAIRQVEEYEREQALKAELLRREQLRKEEERRRKELEERILREGQRRRDVAAKFAELRHVLNVLNKAQRGSVSQEHRVAETQLRDKAEADMAALLERQANERESLRLKAQKSIAKRREEMKAERTSRLAEEKVIVEEYTVKLRKYWTGRPSGKEEITAALNDLRRKMDKAFGAWQTYMDEQLDAYSFRVREELDIWEELADEKWRRLESAARDEEEALAKRTMAERRWVREVAQERERLLDEREVEELEDGEDIGAWFDEDLSRDLLRLEEGLPAEGSEDELVPVPATAAPSVPAVLSTATEGASECRQIKIPGAFVQ